MSRSRKQLWQTHIKSLESSGLSRAEYCRQHQISYHSLTYWVKRLSAQAVEPMTLVPVTIDVEQERQCNTPLLPALRVTLPGGIAVEVAEHFSSITLSRLLSVLKEQ